MLEPYVERSTDVVLQPASVNVVVSESKVELDSELSGNSFGPTDTTRLTNTDALRNLHSELCYLSESQRLDLEKLLPEFDHLFPDFLSKMDPTYDDVKVSVASFKQNPSKRQCFRKVIT